MVTLIGPVVTFVGTTACKVVLVTGGVKLADAPLKLTLVAPSKFWPVIVTVVPGALFVGAKVVIEAGR